MTTNNSVNVGLSGSTGSGNFVGANTPTLITPIIGAAIGTSLSLSGSLTVGTTSGGITVGLSSTTTGITLNNNTTSYSPAVLNYYESKQTANGNASGAVSSGTQTFSFTRIGSQVFCSWADFTFTATATSALTFSTVIPTRFLPANNTFLAIFVQNSTNQSGFFTANTSGTIQINTNNYGTFTNTNGCNFYSGCVSWTV